MVAKYKKLFLAFSFAVISTATVFLFAQPVSAADYDPPCKNGDALYEVVEDGATVKKCKNDDPATTPPGAKTEGADTNDDVTCAVEKIGWIVCPILEGMARISDNMFDVLANNFLQADVSLIRDTKAAGSSEDSGTKQAWEVARNLANIMFIIAFIAIIISQVTNMGINNYGIKKMLPRLIVAAIAVNVSYYICQIVVDLTNILGYEIQNTLVGIADGIGPSVFGNASEYSGFAANPQGLGEASDVGVLTVVIVAALASTAAWLILGPGIAVISGAIIIVLAIILMLLLRKALIVLLIVISPIAFVLYLLPNTEKFFSKWMKMFGQILMVFPVIGLLFGAGQLASTIILVSGASEPTVSAENCDAKAVAKATDTTVYNNYQGKCDGFITITGTRSNPGDATKSLGSGKGASWTLGLVAMGVAVAPLVASYAVLKGALSAAGAIGGTISSIASKGRNSGSRLAGKLDKRKQESMQGAWQRYQSRNINGIGGTLARRKAARTDRLARSKSDLERNQSHYVEDQLLAGNLTKGLSEEGQKRALDQAQALQNKRDVEDVQNALTKIEYYVSPDNDPAKSGKLAGAEIAFDQGFAKGDYVQAKAAVGALTTTGEGGINKLYEGLKRAEASAKTVEQRTFVNNMKEYMLQAHSNVKEKNAAIGEWIKDREGKQTLQQYADSSATYSKLTDKQFSTQTEGSLSSAGAQSALAEMQQTADGGMESRGYRLLSNQETATELNDVKRGIISANSKSTPPPGQKPPSSPTPPSPPGMTWIP